MVACALESETAFHDGSAQHPAPLRVGGGKFTPQAFLPGGTFVALGLPPLKLGMASMRLQGSPSTSIIAMYS